MPIPQPKVDVKLKSATRPNQIKKAKRKEAQQKQNEQLPPMIDSPDPSDSEPEKTLAEQLEELESEIEDVTPTIKIPDVFCCCFDCGFEGSYQEVNSHENVCSLRHYNMEIEGK